MFLTGFIVGVITTFFVSSVASFLIAMTFMRSSAVSRESAPVADDTTGSATGKELLDAMKQKPTEWDEWVMAAGKN